MHTSASLLSTYAAVYAAYEMPPDYTPVYPKLSFDDAASSHELDSFDDAAHHHDDPDSGQTHMEYDSESDYALITDDEQRHLQQQTQHLTIDSHHLHQHHQAYR